MTDDLTPYRIERARLADGRYEFVLLDTRIAGETGVIAGRISNSPIPPASLRNTQARLNTNHAMAELI